MRRKLKIGVVVDQLLPGGVQKAAIEEVRWLNRLGQNAKLLVLMRKGFEKKYTEIVKDIPYEFLSDRYPKSWQKSVRLPFFHFLSTLHLLSPILAPIKVKSAEFDIIVSHGTTTTLATWSLSKFRQIPYLAVIHDPMVYILDKVYSATPLKYFFPILKPVASFLEKNFTKSAKLCLVDSSVHDKYLQQKYGVKPVILYHGINLPKKLPQKLGDAILSFGRWDAGKKPEILLKLIKSIPKAKLIFAGSWTNKQDLEHFRKQVKKLGLKKRIEIITKYTEKELPQICEKGRLWVHPHFEAFSLSALEAAAHGLPIIIPAKSGVTELFENGVHGFFPKKTSLTDFQKPVSLLLGNQKLAFQMGRKAAEVARNYTPIERAVKLLDLINNIFYPKPTKIIALETGAVSGSLVAGGDRLLEEMTKKVKIPLNLIVIVPKIAQKHWKQSGFPVQLKILPGNPFEKYTGPFGVFANYLARTWQGFLILAKVKPDTLVYSSTGIWPDILPTYFVKFFKPKIRWIARIHHLSPSPNKRPGRYWVNLGAAILQKISLFAIKSKANLILVLNSELKKELAKSGFENHKMVVLGGGVDFAAISKFKPLKTQNFDGVFLGRIHPTKGIFDLIPIWSRVTQGKPGTRLAIIGSGPNELIKVLKSQIKKFNLEKNITLTGFLSQTQVWSILKGAKVFLFTDYEAGFGLAATEAMAAGCPVVGWDIGVLGTVFKAGFLKSPLGDFDTFAKNILKILEIKTLATKLSQQAILEAKKLDWAKTTNQFEQILKNF